MYLINLFKSLFYVCIKDIVLITRIERIEKQTSFSYISPYSFNKIHFDITYKGKSFFYTRTNYKKNPHSNLKFLF